ncbi:serine/threonine protein kinase [Micrococcus porci]
MEAEDAERSGGVPPVGCPATDDWFADGGRDVSAWADPPRGGEGPAAVEPGVGEVGSPAELDPVDRPPQAPGLRVVSRIGMGGQAEAWLVRREDGTECVLKVPRADGDPDAVANEAAVYGHLRHPHLLRVLGTVETDRGTGVLSERLPAGSLASMVHDAGPLRPGQAVTVLVPVAQALAHLHEHGVVHGDVSPGNVLFGVDGRPALADLGVARVVGGTRGRGGTPGFTAPEDEAGVGEGGAAADVYAWGALGWFALTGRAPGPREHRAPLPVLVPDVPVELALLLSAALDPDPAGRPGAAEAAVAAYDAAPPEPVPLHESAPAEVAHLLPTVVPPARPGGSGDARRSRPRAGGRRDAGPGRGGRMRRNRSPRSRGWHPVMLVGAAVLAGTVVSAAVGGLTDRPESQGEGAGSRAVAAPPTSPTAAPADPRASVTPTGAADPKDAITPTSDGGVPSAAGTGPAAVLPAEDAAAALAAVAEGRTAALTDPDPARVDAYAVPDGPAWRRDRAIQDQLREGGSAFSGLVVTLEADGRPRPAGAGGSGGAEAGWVVVPAVLRMSAHTVLDDAGSVVGEVPASEEDVSVTLVPGGEGRWRAAAVDPR